MAARGTDLEKSEDGGGSAGGLNIPARDTRRELMGQQYFLRLARERPAASCIRPFFVQCRGCGEGVAYLMCCSLTSFGRHRFFSGMRCKKAKNSNARRCLSISQLLAEADCLTVSLGQTAGSLALQLRITVEAWFRSSVKVLFVQRLIEFSNQFRHLFWVLFVRGFCCNDLPRAC